ncbi:SPFH domain-containing protein [Tahibacter amnicola]|uniref:SPFH domain-containing protein n=1 Tax=Tahibacter amnicola TaxID=2976241 RepID=A0ABY6BJX2_9GAMM|nr:SPFH domain-containing protein [Tahibacter amnicola]UXI69901.1 SPFH domain-containing protein [Tahibacter amnicola]
MNEKQAWSVSGLPTLFAFIAAYVAVVAAFIYGASQQSPPFIIGAMFTTVMLTLLTKGFFQVQPNQGKVMQLFGRYAGTVRDEGLRWTNPFYSKRDVSLRVRNFESSKLKVNDSEGNPIEIGAVVVWQVVDTAEAVFRVDDYEDFVQIQSEAALRQMATSYPYDSHDTGEPALLSHPKVVNQHLRDEIQERLGRAGVDVIEARITHLAYAQEIAQAMLQRQQAGAIIAARTRIVEGAVSMVEMALQQLHGRGVVTLDEERKAAMVSNLLVVLCGERAIQPVVNAGTLHH